MSFDHNSLAVGDHVAYTYSKGLANRITFATVARFTATQIILSDGTRFHRKDGRQIGDWHTSLVAADGPEATYARVHGVHLRALNALYELQRTSASGKANAVTQWLDRVANVVAESRNRLDEIPGRALLDEPAVAYADDDPNAPKAGA